MALATSLTAPRLPARWRASRAILVDRAMAATGAQVGGSCAVDASAQRKAAHLETRSRPSRMTSTMATSSAARRSTSASDSTPRPRGRGRCAVRRWPCVPKAARTWRRRSRHLPWRARRPAAECATTKRRRPRAPSCKRAERLRRAAWRMPPLTPRTRPKGVQRSDRRVSWRVLGQCSIIAVEVHLAPVGVRLRR